MYIYMYICIYIYIHIYIYIYMYMEGGATWGYVSPLLPFLRRHARAAAPVNTRAPACQTED